MMKVMVAGTWNILPNARDRDPLADLPVQGRHIPRPRDVAVLFMSQFAWKLCEAGHTAKKKVDLVPRASRSMSASLQKRPACCVAAKGRSYEADVIMLISRWAWSAPSWHDQRIASSGCGDRLLHCGIRLPAPALFRSERSHFRPSESVLPPAPFRFVPKADPTAVALRDNS